MTNAMSDPFASWPMALVGPRVDLQHEATSLQWDTPSPYEGETAKMMVKVDNLGGSGQVAFALQELVDGGFWATVSTVELDASPGDQIMTSLPVVANDPAGSSIDYRVVVLVDGVEMDRHSVDSLLIKAETSGRRGVVPATFHRCVQRYPVHHCIGVCVIWPLRHGAASAHAAPETEEELADQTDVVAEEMKAGKAVPTLAAVPPAQAMQFLRHPSLDRTVPTCSRSPNGTPRCGHRSSGTRTDGSTSMRFLSSEGRPWKMIRSTGC